MAPKVVVLGNINQDFVMTAERMPRPGETLLGDNLRFVAGGKGANQAVTAARLGAETTLIGRVGNDAFGPLLLENLRREGVETRYIGTDDEAATGAAFIALSPEGENSIISVPGANMRCLPRHVDAVRHVIRSADICLAQFAVPLESVEMLISIAAEEDIPVLVDPTPPRDRLPANFFSATCTTPNETEAEWVFGQAVSDLSTAKQAACGMYEQGIAVAVVKLGAKGCVVCDADGPRHIAGYPQKPVDTTGAGDAFAAGLGVGLAEGMPVNEAIFLANACGALACTRFGAQPSLPRREETDRFLAEHRDLTTKLVTAL